MLADLGENPRVANRAAPDHQAARAGLREHLCGTFRGVDVAIREHGPGQPRGNGSSSAGVSMVALTSCKAASPSPRRGNRSAQTPRAIMEASARSRTSTQWARENSTASKSRSRDSAQGAAVPNAGTAGRRRSPRADASKPKAVISTGAQAERWAERSGEPSSRDGPVETWGQTSNFSSGQAVRSTNVLRLRPAFARPRKV